MRPFALALATTVVVGAAQAQTFPPPPTDGTVYDGAHLLSPANIRTIVRVSREFRRDTGAPIVVATFPSLESVGAKAVGVEAYSTALFNRWRIGHAAEGGNGGILILVAKADRKVRIELGKDWRHDYDAGAKRINQETILPAFRQGDFAGGIVRGSQALANLASNSPSTSAAQDFSPSAPSSMPESMPMGGTDMPGPGMPNFPGHDSGGFPVELLCLGAPIILFIFIAGAISGRRRGFRSYRGGYGRNYGPGPNGPYVNDGSDDAAFLAGMAAGQAMSPPIYDPTPSFDPGPSYDSGPSFDSSPSFDSGSSDSGSSFDSGSSGGGGDTGSW